MRIYHSAQLELGRLPNFVQLIHCLSPNANLKENEYWVEPDTNYSNYFRVSNKNDSFILSRNSLHRWLCSWPSVDCRPISSSTKLHKAIRRFVTTVVDAKLVNTGKHQTLTTFLGREETRELEKAWRSPHMLPRVILSLKDFSEYQTCQLMIHERGRLNAESWSCSGSHDLNFTKTDTNNFNHIFGYIKKSKSKLFDQSVAQLKDVLVVGNFLAKPYNFKNHSAILFLSRDGFLPPGREELGAFNSLTEMISPYLERLLARERADERMSQLILLLETLPIPIELRDPNDLLIFENRANKNRDELNESQSKTISLQSGYKLYVNIELENSFDIDHHRRVSLLGELLNTLQHELNNPLFGLHLSALDMAETTNGETADFFNDIAVNTGRCQKIIKNFSELYMSNKSDSSINLSHFIDEVFILTKSEIRGIQKDVVLEGVTENHIYNFKINAVSLSQILFNLIINAAQAIKTLVTSDQQLLRQHKITLRAKSLDDTIHFSIEDTGPGVSEELRKNLAKPFYTTKAQGTGLGLTISRGLLESIGSNLEISDNQSGQGAVFSFALKITH